MKNKFTLLFALLLLPQVLFAWQWQDLWQTSDQQGAQLLQAGKTKEAAATFHNKDWQGVAAYRAGNFTDAFQAFKQQNTSDAQYNAGNAAAHAERFQEALAAYDKAIALNPNNKDAIANRAIVKKILEQQKKQPPKNGSNKNDKDQNKENKQQQDQKQQQPQNNQANQDKSSDGNQGKLKQDQQQSQDKPSQDKQQQNQQQQQQQQDQQKQEQQQQQQNQAQADQKDQQQQKQAQQQSQPAAAKPDKSEQQQKAAASGKPNQDEGKNQLLRRVADDPGGLLRQKFLRDYYRRHAIDDGNDQGAF